MGACLSLYKHIDAMRPKKDNTTTRMGQKSVLKRYFPLSSEDDEEDDEYLKVFEPLLHSIRFHEVPAYVLSIRKQRKTSRRRFTFRSLFRATSPKVRSPALFGSMHVAFVIVFADGLKLLLKFPATGYRGQFTELEAQSLRAEALTMQLLKRQTTLPVPELYDFSSSCDNPLNCPFILMDFVAGAPMSEYWFDETASQPALEQRRETILQELAQAMHRLNKFTFSQGGSPTFDANGEPAGVESWKQQDFTAMFHPATAVAGEHVIYRQTGHFPTPSSYLRGMLADKDPSSDDEASQADHKLLKMFFDWIPPTAEPERNDFVLTHTDLNLQNILVSPEGHLLGLIDWDGVAAVPRYLANERYPDWLLNDWNPLYYSWSDADDAENCCSHQNSPSELARYRNMYERFVQAAQHPPKEDEEEEAVENATKLTRNSLILATLKKAANEYICAPELVVKIYDEIVRVQTGGEFTGSDKLPFDDDRHLFDVTGALEKGDLDERRLVWIKEGFQALFV